MTLLIIFFSLSIVFSFLCSIWEAVLLSIPRSRVEILLNEDKWIGKTLKGFKENIDKPLAGILSLNTIAHTVGAIGVGAQAARLWGENYINLFGLNVSIEAVVAGLMTLGILILSEIIPKTIGANYWRQLTDFTVYGVKATMILTYPLVWMSQVLTRKLKVNEGDNTLSRSEFYIMARVGAAAGVIDKKEYEILESLNRFKAVKSKDIMTPRTVINASSENASIEDFFEQHKGLPFSRIPIYNTNVDNITGYVLKDEIYASIINGDKNVILKDFSREISVILETSDISRLLHQLSNKNEHIALVVDEYGGVSGIVTMEDVLETLIGIEIMDESDMVEDMRVLAHNIWKERARRLGIIKKDD
ncbi:MAG: hemolysin family protein [Bacteroidota bacterium]